MTTSDSWRSYSIVLYTVGTLLVLLNLIFNVIFLLVAKKRVWSKKKVFLPLISWSAGDLFIGVVLFIDIAVVHLEWIAKDKLYLCLFWNGLHLLPLFVCSLHTLICAVDRFIIILYPTKYDDKLSRNKMLGLIGGSWAYSVVMSCVPFLWRQTTMEHNSCSLTILHFVHVFLYVMLHFLPILTACTFLYAKVFMHFRRQERQVHVTHTLTHDELVANTSLAKLLLCITLLYIAVWIPFCIVSFARVSDLDAASDWHIALWYAYVVGVISSVVKCPCFILLDFQFRVHVKGLFKRKKKQAQFGSSLRD